MHCAYIFVIAVSDRYVQRLERILFDSNITMQNSIILARYILVLTSGVLAGN